MAVGQLVWLPLCPAVGPVSCVSLVLFINDNLDDPTQTNRTQPACCPTAYISRTKLGTANAVTYIGR